MTIMSIVIINSIMTTMRIVTRQERFAEMFGSENTSKLIPSATQVRGANRYQICSFFEKAFDPLPLCFEHHVANFF